jgi:chromosome segregation ATPase
MKKYIFLISILVSSLTTFAQEIKESTTLVNNTNQPCILADYALSGEIIEGAFIKKMADAKISKASKATDGFKLYKGVTISEITKETIDLYYKVEDKKTSAILTLALSKGYDNFFRKEIDSVSIENAKIYLAKFAKDATAFLLNKQMIEQASVVRSLEKKLKGQSKVEEGYTRDKSKIESKINSNKIDIVALKIEMEAQQKALENVKTQTVTVEEMNTLKKELSKQQVATEKVTKKYNSALEDAGTYNENLKKAEDKIADAALEEIKIKSEITEANKKMDDLKTQLANLK